jgi:hypothetical protein
VIALLLTLTFSGVVAEPAAVPRDQTLQLEVRRLVRQLDDPALANREAAERALVELGPDVLEVLPPLARSTSAEVRVRLDRIRQTLQLAAAEATARGSRIDLRGEMKLSEALAALEQQSGNELIDFRQRFGQHVSDPAIETDFEATPFWQALDSVLDQVDLTIYNYSGKPGALAIVARDSEEFERTRRAAYAGLFRFEGASLLARRDLRNPRNDSLRLALEVAWEPRAAPIVLQLPLDQVKAVDEDDRPLTIHGSSSRLEIPIHGDAAATDLQIPFTLPDRRSVRIAAIEGRLDALVPGRIHEFTFDNLATARSVERRSAGVTVTLEQVREDVGVYEARLRIRFDEPGAALESHRGWIYKNEAYLLDADGQRIDPAGSQPTMQRENEVGMAYLFDHQGGLDGHTLVYRTPVVIVAMPVRYRLTDLNLP